MSSGAKRSASPRPPKRERGPARRRASDPSEYLGESSNPIGDARMRILPVEQQSLQAGGHGALEVLAQRIADVERLAGRDTEPGAGPVEDLRLRLAGPLDGGDRDRSKEGREAA